MTSNTDTEIRYWDRHHNQEAVEKVYGDAAVRLLYRTAAGLRVADGILAEPIVSKLYGKVQDSWLSGLKVNRFVKDFSIPMEEYEAPVGGFRSFNQFFIRRFRAGARPFVQDPAIMPAFAEARYLGWRSIRPEQQFPVKGSYLGASQLIGDEAAAKPFLGGPLLLARLCPVDYHRFHFPDGGEVSSQRRVGGPLHSVNPVALQARGDILSTNERQVAFLESENFGRLAIIEVGAMCVGRIVQTYAGDRPVRRGDEKGYFLFGGSTVIVLGEPERWQPSEDILHNTKLEMETLIRLGQPVGTRSKL